MDLEFVRALGRCGGRFGFADRADAMRFVCGDLLPESIRYLREQKHDILLWDHGSTDATPEVVQRFGSELLEATQIPRSFDFYGLYEAMSRHLLANYVKKYDWISWPDQDEFLEGSTRKQSYYEALTEVFHSKYDWVQFNNFNFWFTSADDLSLAEVTQRVRYYALFPDCAPRIRCWRASATNVRAFNHNPPLGRPCPVRFNLRHYPMRSAAQMQTRLSRDRADLRRGDANFHYENMASWQDRLQIEPAQLHYDDFHNELNPDPIFDWRRIYGYAQSAVRS
jgi:hypothetical protein